MPIIEPIVSIGTMILMSPQEDGQRFRSSIVELIKDHSDQVINDPAYLKFKCLINEDLFEEIITYNGY